MSGILAKYAGLKIINDNERTTNLIAQFATMGEGESSLHYAGNAFIGQAFIKDSPGAQQAIIEIIVSSDGIDSFATLFEPHPLFSNRDLYREGREELYQCVLDLADASVAGLAVKCPQRKRQVMVRDLGIVQLIQLIQSAVDGWTNDTSSTKH